MPRNRTIQYAIDNETNLILSRVGSEVMFPIINFGGMNPSNNYNVGYTLEKDSVYQTIGMNLTWTRKIPTVLKNEHRRAWGMKELKQEKCPVCESENIRADFDFPKTMRCCKQCGSDFLSDGEVVLNARKIK